MFGYGASDASESSKLSTMDRLFGWSLLGFALKTGGAMLTTGAASGTVAALGSGLMYAQSQREVVSTDGELLRINMSSLSDSSSLLKHQELSDSGSKSSSENP